MNSRDLKLLITSFIILFCSFFTIQSYAQDQPEPNIFEEEKFSIEPGIGIQYGVFGLRGKYYFSKNLGVSLGGGTIGTGLIWNAALEFRSPRIINNRVTPFFNVMYGVNSGVLLETNGIEENKLFTGVTSSAGIKLNLIKKWKTYLSIGINYRWIGSNVSKFVEEFNEVHNSTHVRNLSNLFPTIGITYVFK